MAGLLDMVNDPRQAFLTNLGMGLLSAGGPSARPVSLGQAFGAAMPGALQGAQQAQTYQAQQAEEQSKRLKEQQQLKAVGMMPPEAQQAVMAGVPIADVWKQLNPEAKFESYFDPTSGQERKGFIKPGAAPMPVGGAKVESMEYDKVLRAAGILPGTPQYTQMMRQYATKQATHTPAAQVNVGIKQESEEAKAIGGELGKQYSGLQNAALTSQSTLSKLNRAESLLSGLDTGALTPIGMKASALSESLGITVDPKLPQKQAFEAIANELALRAKQQGETNLMPGAMSEADRNFLVAMAPNLAKTPGANKILIETMKRMEKRNIEIAKLARQYRSQKKTFEGFAEVAQEYAERNPLFGDMQIRSTTSTPARGAKFLGFE